MSKVQELLKNAYENYGDLEFISYMEDQKRIEKSFKEVIGDVLSLSSSFISSNLLDKNILLIGKNSYEWLVSWTAIIGYVGVVIPVDNSWTVSSINNILNKLDVSCIIYSKDYSVIDEVKENHTDILYFCLEDDISKLILEGKRIIAKKKDMFDFKDVDNEMACELIPDTAVLKDVSFITYTTRNLLANFDNFHKRLPLNMDDKIYIHLPMYTSYINIYAYLYSYYVGNKIYIGNSELERIEEEKPTVFFGVPKDYINTAKNYDEEKLVKKIKSSKSLKKLGINVNREKYFKTFRKKLGGNLKYLLCFGNLPKEIRKLYLDVGLKVQTFYGVEATASLISFDYASGEDIFSDGKILENMDIKICDPNSMKCGEIIVKGENVSRCYYNNAKKTSEVFDYDGYYHTGDLGYIKENELFLVGNTKNKVMLDTGKVLYPKEVEELFLETNKFDTVNIYEKNGLLNLNVITSLDKENVAEIVQDINQKLPYYMQIQEKNVHSKKRG